MAQVAPATVKAMALEFYGYALSDEAARMAAHVAAAMVARAEALTELGLGAVETPLSYLTMVAEASRLCRAR